MAKRIRDFPNLRVTAEYDVEANFAKGEANIHLALIKHGEAWQIIGFKVNSPALVPR